MMNMLQALVRHFIPLDKTDLGLYKCTITLRSYITAWQLCKLFQIIGKFSMSVASQQIHEIRRL